jgi:hypothetical protein
MEEDSVKEIDYPAIEILDTASHGDLIIAESPALCRGVQREPVRFHRMLIQRHSPPMIDVLRAGLLRVQRWDIPGSEKVVLIPWLDDYLTFFDFALLEFEEAIVFFLMSLKIIGEDKIVGHTLQVFAEPTHASYP